MENDRFKLSSFLDIAGKFGQFLGRKLWKERSDWVWSEDITRWNTTPFSSTGGIRNSSNPWSPAIAVGITRVVSGRYCVRAHSWDSF